MAKRVWTLRRQILSNVLPIVPFCPFPFLAVWLEAHGKMSMAVAVWVASPLILWASINFLGLFSNESLKRALKPLASSGGTEPAMRIWFVGFGMRGKRTVLHPHYDVGWLLLFSEELVFVGERERVFLKKAEITGIGFSPNIHTLLGLGRWVVIEGRTSQGRLRFFVEPREYRTLLGNLRLSKRLALDVRKWWLGKR